MWEKDSIVCARRALKTLKPVKQNDDESNEISERSAGETTGKALSSVSVEGTTYLYKIAAWGGTEDKSNTLHPLAITSA